MKNDKLREREREDIHVHVLTERRCECFCTVNSVSEVIESSSLKEIIIILIHATNIK